MIEGSRLLVGAEPLGVPTAKRDAMSVKSFREEPKLRSKILQTNRSLV
jgi:hypothetical protein